MSKKKNKNSKESEKKPTLLCLIVREGSNCKFWEKNPQVHLIIIKE